jgi:hypothetical protein
MPFQEGHEGSQRHHHEEWETSYTGDMSFMWHKDVQNRKELNPDSSIGINIGLDTLVRYPALFFIHAN